eukprot:CAMPEP_0168621270 /NCGR_PEP_ID=MMETSP0449_2-20121227/7598_1 /TAXON_ID=1082188 /ORGANISM="Strombidium rassoulzadegani, Strain ras09" /LENGTH=118 /DNA_ID=CAMNT_0008662365 /DNA_START=92 /DNA_END=448 /DNA_ORIENTATION=+
MANLERMSQSLRNTHSIEEFAKRFSIEQVDKERRQFYLTKREEFIRSRVKTPEMKASSGSSSLNEDEELDPENYTGLLELERKIPEGKKDFCGALLHEESFVHTAELIDLIHEHQVLD